MTKRIYILLLRPDIESFIIVGAFKGKRSLNKFIKENNIDLEIKSYFNFYQVEEVELK